jgi:hypothetical protein
VKFELSSPMNLGELEIKKKFVGCPQRNSGACYQIYLGQGYSFTKTS